MTRVRYLRTERLDERQNDELDALVVRLRSAIGQVLDQLTRLGIATLPEPVILAGRREAFAPCHLATPAGTAAWCVFAVSRLTVARTWLDAARAQDAADLLAARCDEGEVPLVFLFPDGTVSLSRAHLRTGDVA